MHEIGFEPWTPKISGAVFGAIPSVLLTVEFLQEQVEGEEEVAQQEVVVTYQ